jgi:hypothetical protein
VLRDAKGGELGNYLFETRVQVLQGDTFPSSAIADVQLSEVSRSFMLFELFKMFWGDPVVKKGTIWCFLVDLVNNIWYFLKLFMTVYLLDYIIRIDKELLFIKDRKLSLYAYASITILVFGLLHILEYSKLDSRIGASKHFLQNALIRKFLNFSTFARQQVTVGDIVMAIQRDANDVVMLGYMAILKIFYELEKLLFMLLFKLLSPALFGEKFDAAAVIPLFIFPALLGPFLPFREKAISESLTEANETEEDFMDQITQITQNYSMVIDYQRRSFAADMFHHHLKKHGSAVKDGKQILLNT